MTSFSIAWMKIQEFALTAKKKNANEAEVEDWEVTNYAVAPGEPKLARQDSWAHAEEQRVGIGLSTHSYSTNSTNSSKANLSQNHIQ